MKCNPILIRSEYVVDNRGDETTSRCRMDAWTFGEKYRTTRTESTERCTETRVGMLEIVSVVISLEAYFAVGQLFHRERVGRSVRGHESRVLVKKKRKKRPVSFRVAAVKIVRRTRTIDLCSAHVFGRFPVSCFVNGFMNSSDGSMERGAREELLS